MQKFFGLLVLVLLSCSKPAKQEVGDMVQLETQPAFSFQGKVFFLGPSKKECQIYAECDCCTSELAFINENDFVLVDFCTEENVWTTGTYRADSITLTLTFQQKAVVSAVDLFKPESGPTITLDTAQIKPITFSRPRWCSSPTRNWVI